MSTMLSQHRLISYTARILAVLLWVAFATAVASAQCNTATALPQIVFDGTSQTANYFASQLVDPATVNVSAATYSGAPGAIGTVTNGNCLGSPTGNGIGQGVILSTGNVHNLVDTTKAVIGVEALPFPAVGQPPYLAQFGQWNGLPAGSVLGPDTVGNATGAPADRMVVHLLTGSQLDATNKILYPPDGNTGYNPGPFTFPFPQGTQVTTNPANAYVGTVTLPNGTVAQAPWALSFPAGTTFGPDTSPCPFATIYNNSFNSCVSFTGPQPFTFSGYVDTTLYNLSALEASSLYTSGLLSAPVVLFPNVTPNGAYSIQVTGAALTTFSPNYAALPQGSFVNPGFYTVLPDATVIRSWAFFSPNPGIPFDLPVMTPAGATGPIDPNTGVITLGSSGIVGYGGQPFPNLGGAFTLPRNYDDFYALSHGGGLTQAHLISTPNHTAGDPALDALTGGTTVDDASLSITFTPTNASLNYVEMTYVFSSDEYNDFVNQPYNDAFAFFLNGLNVALLPNSEVPVSINSANGGNPLGVNATNSNLYIDNTAGQINTQMNGMTVVMHVYAPLNTSCSSPPCSNTMRVSIANEGDMYGDSNVLVKLNSLTAVNISALPSAPGPDTAVNTPTPSGNLTNGYVASTPQALFDSLANISSTAPQQVPLGFTLMSATNACLVGPWANPVKTPDDVTVTFSAASQASANTLNVSLSYTDQGPVGGSSFLISIPTNTQAEYFVPYNPPGNSFPPQAGVNLLTPCTVTGSANSVRKTDATAQCFITAVDGHGGSTTPTPGHPPDTLQVQVVSGTFVGYSSGSFVTLGVGSGCSTLGTTVPPTANPDSEATAKGIPITFNVLADAGDLSLNGGLKVTAVGPTTNKGTVSVSNGAQGLVTYTPSKFLGGSGPWIDTFTYTITDAAGATASNTVTVNISGALPVLTVTTVAASKPYGAQLPAFTATYSVSSGSVSACAASGTLAFDTPATPFSPLGTYSATPAGLTSTTCSIAFKAGTLAVTPAALRITASAQTKTYGQTLTFGSGSTQFTTAGLQNGETVGSVTLGSNGGSAATAVGTYSITPSSATGGTFAASNYNVTYSNGALTVNKAPLTVSANNLVKVPGSANPPLTVSYSGFVNGDTPSTALTGSLVLTTTANASSPAGIYPITAATNTLAAANYSVTFVPGTSFVVNTSTLLSLSNLVQAYDGTPKQVSVTAPAACGTGKAVVTYNGSTTPPANIGSYQVLASIPNTACAATGTLIIFGYAAGGGTFVIGDISATSGASQMFWGAQWWKNNSLSGGTGPASFKGFADKLSSAPPQCGGTWTSDPGNSSGPPASIPAYLAVVVSSSVTQSGSVESGNIKQIVIVQTNSGYADNPGHAGSGVIVAQLCPAH